MAKRPTFGRTTPGRFYGITGDGRFQELPGQDHVPNTWICRRVADYDIPIPPEAGRAPCTQCGAEVAYNPARAVTAPKVCMQCAGVTPLPFRGA